MTTFYSIKYYCAKNVYCFAKNVESNRTLTFQETIYLLK